MPILMVGISHRNTPLHIRERVHLKGEAAHALSAQLVAGGWRECVILSTCNRLEIYGMVDDHQTAENQITHYLETQAGQTLPIYIHQDLSALHHLMRVASGLDSAVFGEAQILGQVVKASEQAKETGPILTRFFQQAISTGKKARCQTQISHFSISLGQIAVRLAQHHYGDLSQRTIVLIGAGEVGEHVIKAFRHNNAGRLICLNRTDSKARELAERISGESLPWDSLAQALTLGDVIITATSTDAPFIFPQDLPRPTLLIDLSLPRNISPDQLHPLYTLDDLRLTAASNLNRREEAIQKIEALMMDDGETFWEWYRAREVAPMIAELHKNAQAIIAAEIKRMGSLSPQEAEAMQLLAHRITSKLLHEPTLFLKKHAQDEQAIRILTNAFKID